MGEHVAFAGTGRGCQPPKCGSSGSSKRASRNGTPTMDRARARVTARRTSAVRISRIACAHCADHFPQGDCGADERVDPQEQEAWTPHHVFAASSFAGAFTFELPEENCGPAGQHCADEYERARYGKDPAPPGRPRWLLFGELFFLCFRHVLTL